MGILKDKDRNKVQNLFKQIDNDVTILMFTQETECQRCEMTRKMLEEISGLSDRISLEVHDFVAEGDLAKKHGVDKIPATVLLGDKDYGIRFYGVPAGYEFNVLIQDIRDVGKRNPGLSEAVTAELAKIDEPIHLQVIISPT
ncbi:MAG: thioredoxin family protein [Deltaproteobacteria bacterium]|nr:thioredoxin family protein [Deltaproteobacteria bacterium]